MRLHLILTFEMNNYMGNKWYCAFVPWKNTLGNDKCAN
jgi:hypothetical protein